MTLLLVSVDVKHLVESLPQLATQWIVIHRTMRANGNVIKPIEPLQLLSIITSTLAVVAALVEFISRKRRSNFVSLRQPLIASLIPVALWILLSVSCGTIGVFTSWDSGYGRVACDLVFRFL